MGTERLEGQEIFKMLRPDQMKRLSEVSTRISLEAGGIVFRSGEPADYLYVVLEGEVALRAPGREGTSLLVDQARVGDVFGSCVCLQLSAYALNARCTVPARLLKVEAATLRRLLHDDKVMGYAIQQLISRVYFKRYLETAKKLQAVVQAMPVEPT
jgi:CRP-like cAMP-binding protein